MRAVSPVPVSSASVTSTAFPATSRPAAPARPADLPIETVRAIAILVLVSFHVIGGDGGGGGRGLGVTYPHPLRYYADLLVDIRMPLFAFVAGVVYALKPVEPAQLGRFLLGKLRRLAVPGITVFMLMAVVMGSREGRIITHPWDAYLHHYAIFWFLQVMLVIFVTYGTLDILTRGRVLLPALALALLALAMGWRFDATFLALNRYTHLMAYFLLGVAFCRYQPLVQRRRGLVLAVALAALAAGLAMNLAVLNQTGAFSTERLDLQSLLLGSGTSVAAFLLLPSLRWLSWLGAYSLTIYLYHILFTSTARRVLFSAGIDSPWAHVLIGTALGISLPIALHLLSNRFRLSRLLVLGLRDRNAGQRRAAGAMATA
nr:acyltransferase [Paracoccus limosus]